MTCKSFSGQGIRLNDGCGNPKDGRPRHFAPSVSPFALCNRQQGFLEGNGWLPRNAEGDGWLPHNAARNSKVLPCWKLTIGGKPCVCVCGCRCTAQVPHDTSTRRCLAGNNRGGIDAPVCDASDTGQRWCLSRGEIRIQDGSGRCPRPSDTPRYLFWRRAAHPCVCAEFRTVLLCPTQYCSRHTWDGR